MLHEGTLAPNEWRMIGAGAHSQIFIMECDNEYLDVKFDGLSKFPMYRGVPAKFNFENVIISNPHAAAINYKIYTAQKGMEFQEGRSIEAGPTSILGTVGTVGSPLTDDGGSIALIGTSGYTGAIPSASETEIISEAVNTAGVIIRTLTVDSDALPSVSIKIKKAGASRYIANIDESQFHLPRELFIPIGWGFFSEGGTGANGYMYMTYDIL